MAEAWTYTTKMISPCVFSRRCVAIVNVGNFNVRNFLRISKIIIVVLNTFDLVSVSTLVLLSVRFLNYRYEQQTNFMLTAFHKSKARRISENHYHESKICGINWWLFTTKSSLQFITDARTRQISYIHIDLFKIKINPRNVQNCFIPWKPFLKPSSRSRDRNTRADWNNNSGN